MNSYRKLTSPWLIARGGNRYLGMSVFLLLIISLLPRKAFTATYFFTNTGGATVTTLSNWSTNSSGIGGTNPTNFTTTGDIFNIRPTAVGTVGAAWTIGTAGGTANITVNDSGTLTLSTFLVTLNGNAGNSSKFNVIGTIIFSTNTSPLLNLAVNNAANTFTLNAAGTLRTANTTGVVGTSCSITKQTNAVVTLTAGTIEFSASAGQTMNGLPTAITNLTLSGTGAKTLLNTLTSITGNLTLMGSATTATTVGLTIGGQLSLTDGTTFTAAGFALTVTGATTVGVSTLTISSATGSKTFGDITVNSGGIWNNSINTGVTISGSLTNTGTFTAGSGVYTFTGAGKTINGTVTIPSLSVTGTCTNNGTLTVTTALAGAGTLTQGISDILNLGGTSTITGLTVSASGNTVNYYGAAQTVKAVSYVNLGLAGSNTKTLTSLTTVTGNLTMSGTANATTAAGLAIGGNLNVGTGTTFTVPAFAITVTGATTIGVSTLTISSATGTKTFGDITVNNGGIWNNTGPSAVTVTGSLTNTGTFTAGSGVYTFSGTGKTINGTVTIPSITVTGSCTNNGTLTVTTALAGAGTLTQGANDILNLGGTSAITNLIATAAGNIVNYNGAAQTINATPYVNLVLAGSSTKALTSVTTVTGDLTMSGTANATTGAGLTIGGNLGIGNGTTFTAAGFALTVTGATTVGTSTLTISSATGTKTFDNITVNSGGVWNNSGNSAVVATGSLTNTGTFTAGSGVYTFSGTGESINGTVTIPSLTVTGTCTNNGTLTVTTALAGAGTLTQGASDILNLGGTATITTLDATATGNQVNYQSGSAQTVLPITYYDLNFTGAGTKTINTGGTITIANNWAIASPTSLAGTATASVTGNITGAGAITMGSGSILIGGSWSNNGTFTAGTGTVDFNGSGAQTLPARTFYSLIISNAGIKSIQTATTVTCRTFVINGSATLNVLGTGGMTVTL